MKKKTLIIARRKIGCADQLAKLGASMENDFAVFSCPPVGIVPFVEADCRGQYVNRLCPVSVSPV